MQKVSQSNFVVAEGQTVSSPIELNGGVIEAFITPAAMDSVSMTFEAVCEESVNTGVAPLTGEFKQVVDTAGVALTVTVAANRYIVIDHRALSGCRWLRAVMGTAETPGITIGVAVGQAG